MAGVRWITRTATAASDRIGKAPVKTVMAYTLSVAALIGCIEAMPAAGSLNLADVTPTPAPTPTLAQAATPTPTPTPAPTPTPTPSPVSVALMPIAVVPPSPPAAYAVPAGAVQVSTSAGLIAALQATTPTDIVLADGVYDNAAPFSNTNGHRLYAARLLGATLTAGINAASSYGQPNALVRGIAFDVRDPAKTAYGGVIFSWGTSVGMQVLDSTFEGNGVISAGILSYQSDGMVIQRIQAHNFTDWGVLATNSSGSAALPVLLEDIDVASVSRPTPMSNQGRSEGCVGLGYSATMRRVHARNCAWMGIVTFGGSNGSSFRDLDIDGTPYGLYLEHFTSNSTFERMHIGPSVVDGVVCEGTDPNGAAWGGVSASIDNFIQDSTIESTQVGVLMGWATTRTTVRRVIFRSQYANAITDYLGVNNAYYDNDYSGIQPGAQRVSPYWWRL
jgi:hypothetical protein